MSRPDPSPAIVSLAILIAALAAIMFGTTASASAVGVAETRVGASNVVVEPLVGPPEHITAGQQLGEAANRVISAVATGVAANTARTFGAHSADDLLQAGLRTDRNGLTGVGRALQKHANRLNSAYPQVAGRDLNASGQQVLERILRDPRTATQSYKHPNPNYGGGVLDLRLPDVGARFSSAGDFIGFL